MNKRDFYERCAQIIGCTHAYSSFNDKIYRIDDRGNPCVTNATRWGGREPGNGRFPGYGTIRRFGSVIHVCLTHPISFTGTFTDDTEFFEFLMRCYAHK